MNPAPNMYTDIIGSAKEALPRAATSGAIAGVLSVTVGDASAGTSAMYALQLGIIDLITDTGLCMIGQCSTSMTHMLDVKHLMRTGAATVLYAVAHMLMPSMFPYVRGSWKNTAILNAVSLYLGSVAGDRIRASIPFIKDTVADAKSTMVMT